MTQENRVYVVHDMQIFLKNNRLFIHHSMRSCLFCYFWLFSPYLDRFHGWHLSNSGVRSSILSLYFLLNICTILNVVFLLMGKNQEVPVSLSLSIATREKKQKSETPWSYYFSAACLFTVSRDGAGVPQATSCHQCAQQLLQPCYLSKHSGVKAGASDMYVLAFSVTISPSQALQKVTPMLLWPQAFTLWTFTVKGSLSTHTIGFLTTGLRCFRVPCQLSNTVIDADCRGVISGEVKKEVSSSNPNIEPIWNVRCHKRQLGTHHGLVMTFWNSLFTTWMKMFCFFSSCLCLGLMMFILCEMFDWNSDLPVQTASCIRRTWDGSEMSFFSDVSF